MENSMQFKMIDLKTKHYLFFVLCEVLVKCVWYRGHIIPSWLSALCLFLTSKSAWLLPIPKQYLCFHIQKLVIQVCPRLLWFVFLIYHYFLNIYTYLSEKTVEINKWKNKFFFVHMFPLDTRGNLQERNYISYRVL